MYEQELSKNEQLEQRYRSAVSERARAERKCIDIVNQYESIIWELEQLKAAYHESLDSIMEKEAECEYMRRALLIIMNEIKKMNPHKLGADIDIE